MKALKLIIVVACILLTVSCSSHDDSSTVDNTPTLDDQRDLTTEILTLAGNSKTWRISEAMLLNGNTEIDISQNFNVIDDEFVFKGTTNDGNLEWKKGFTIRTNAANVQETLIDKYVSAISTSFSYQEGSSTIIEADFGSCVFEVNEDETIAASITNEDNTIFNFTLVEKMESDYATASQNGLNFSTAFTFESNSIACCAPGMIGSYADNSFFIATREFNSNQNPERIIKFDLATNTVIDNAFNQTDFVSKQLHIIEDQIIVVGGQYVNTYDLNISGDPISINHGKTFSRHGISVLDEDIYIIGGDLNEVENNKVFRWNTSTQTLNEFATLSEPKSGARATIVNNNLYVFGGTEAFLSNTPTNTILKVNVGNPTDIESFEMNKAIDFTFVQKFQNLIYVAGRIDVKDDDGQVIAREASIGVFNTLDNTYEELATNLTNPSGFFTIHQMCIFNGKMYIIYGDEGTDNGGQFNEWEVLASDLN